MDIFQGKSSVAEVSRKYDLTPATVEEWMEEARRGMENQLRARPKDIAAMYEEKIKEMNGHRGADAGEYRFLVKRSGSRSESLSSRKKYDFSVGEEKK